MFGKRGRRTERKAREQKNARTIAMVLGSWFLVLGSWFLVLGSWFLVLGSWFLVLGSWFLVLGSWFLVLGSWFFFCIPMVLCLSIFFLFYDLCSRNMSQYQTMQQELYVTIAFAALNSSLNVFVYHWINSEIRSAILKVLEPITQRFVHSVNPA